MNIQDDKPSEKATGSQKRKHDKMNPVPGSETSDYGPYSWKELGVAVNGRGKKPRNLEEEHETLQETPPQAPRDNETPSPTRGSFEPAQDPDIDSGNTLSPSVTDVPDREGEASEEGGSRTFVDVTDKSSETEEWYSSGDDPESDASSSSKDS